MTIRKRVAKAQVAFDRGLHEHVKWHLTEISPLLKDDEADPATQRAKQEIQRLQSELDNL